jgi:hypothetical protein
MAKTVVSQIQSLGGPAGLFEATAHSLLLTTDALSGLMIYIELGSSGEHHKIAPVCWRDGTSTR